MAVVNVRDAVTEAALTIGDSLLKGCVALREEVAVAQRQVSAEETASGQKNGAVRGNPKYMACVQQRDQAMKVSSVT